VKFPDGTVVTLAPEPTSVINGAGDDVERWFTNHAS
jgi:hypothetical protein